MRGRLFGRWAAPPEVRTWLQWWKMDAGFLFFLYIFFFLSYRGDKEKNLERITLESSSSSHHIFCLILILLLQRRPSQLQRGKHFHCLLVRIHDQRLICCLLSGLKCKACRLWSVAGFLVFNPLFPAPVILPARVIFFPPPCVCLKIPVSLYVHFKLICVERCRANVVCRWGCNAHWQSQMVADCGQTRHLDKVQSLASGQPRWILQTCL